MARHPTGWFGRRGTPVLHGRRVTLRPLEAADFAAYRDVRHRNEDWLLPWEPRRDPTYPDPATNRLAFEQRCSAHERDRVSDRAYAFGLFVGGRFAGQVNLNNVLRGALQGATIGYWIDRDLAGHGYVAEGVVVVLRFAFEQLRLERVEICIVPRNHNSRRVVAKLGLRDEGVALRYLEINGVREDHIRYAMTAEEWTARADSLTRDWITG